MANLATKIEKWELYPQVLCLLVDCLTSLFAVTDAGKEGHLRWGCKNDCASDAGLAIAKGAFAGKIIRRLVVWVDILANLFMAACREVTGALDARENMQSLGFANRIFGQKKTGASYVRVSGMILKKEFQAIISEPSKMSITGLWGHDELQGTAKIDLSEAVLFAWPNVSRKDARIKAHRSWATGTPVGNAIRRIKQDGEKGLSCDHERRRRSHRQRGCRIRHRGDHG